MAFSITITIATIADAILEYHWHDMMGDWNGNNVCHNYECSHKIKKIVKVLIIAVNLDFHQAKGGYNQCHEFIHAIVCDVLRG